MRLALSRIRQNIPKTYGASASALIASAFSSDVPRPRHKSVLSTFCYPQVISPPPRVRASRSRQSPKMEFTLTRKDDLSQARHGQLEICGSAAENGDAGSKTELTDSQAGQALQSFQTPMFFIHTVAGSIPHITAEVLDIMLGSKPSPPVLISIDSLSTVVDCVGSSGMGLAKFVGLPSCATMLVVNNPLTTLPPNYNDKHGVSIWSRFGRDTLKIAKYSKIIQDLRPNLYQLMSDYDVSKESTKKRLKKSTERNVDYMEKHFASMKDSTASPSNSAYATIEFNWFMVDAVESAKALAKILQCRDRIAGFLINGVAEHFRDQNQEGRTQTLEILSTILSELPEHAPKFVPGRFEPKSIVELVKLGVDQFDSSFITQLTDKGQALHFRFDDAFHENGVPIPTEALIANEVENDNLNSEGSEADASKSFEVLDLNEKRYFDDFRPVSSSCSCYTCRKYSRSYIHHLLVTEELLGAVLLMGHNLFSFDRLFQAIRQCLETSRSLDTLLEVEAL